MKLSDMRDVLGEKNIQLTKSLGQNFLHDQNQLTRIADSAQISPQDHVLEIGPGLGPLTELLLERAAEVLAIEKDRRLYDILEERFRDNAKLKLVCDDALNCVEDRARHWENYKLVSNLPYSVASPILVELAENPSRPERLVATLQLEVARRLMARVGDDDYGVLTLLLQLRYKASQWFKIPRGCFFPEPDVDSACVVLLRRSAPLLPEEQHDTFKRVVKRAFSQRRKQMAKLLKADWTVERVQKAFEELKLAPDIRGEKLSLEQFVELTKFLSSVDAR
jgi:16S rRNA (adenine1518-N6/adenine1519-N6)-dimethyltransferase